MKGETMTTGTYIIQIKLIGDLDSVKRNFKKHGTFDIQKNWK